MFHVKQLLLIALFFPCFALAQTMGNTILPDEDFPALPDKDEKVEAFISQLPEIKSMSKLNQEWFYWTNYSRINPRRFYDSVVEPLLKALPTLKTANSRSLKSELYKSAALPFLKPNKDLEMVAQQFVDEMSSKNALPSHNSPSGATFQSRMQSINIKYCAGENISWGKPNTVLMLVLLYIDEGVLELGHRKSLLNPSFTEMGIGYNTYPDGKYMVVQDFACDQSK